MSLQQDFDETSEFAAQDPQAVHFGREHRDRQAQITPQMHEYRAFFYICSTQINELIFCSFCFVDDQLASRARTRQVRQNNHLRRTQETYDQQTYQGPTTSVVNFNTGSSQMDTRQYGDSYGLNSQTQYSSYGGSASSNIADQFNSLSADQHGQGKFVLMLAFKFC